MVRQTHGFKIENSRSTFENLRLFIIFLRSGRNASTRPQAKAVHPLAPNVQSSLGSSSLTPTSALDSASEGPRRSFVTVNPNKLGQKIPYASLAESANNSSEGKS